MKTLPDSPLSARDVLRVARPQDAMDEDSVKDIMVARIVEVRKNKEDGDESLISALEDPTVFQSIRQSSSREEGDTWTISNNTFDNTLGGDDSILQSPDSKDDIYNRIYGQSSETIAPTITSNNATLNSSSQHILKNIIDPGDDNEEPLFFDDEDEREVFEICAPSGKLGIVVDSPSSDMPPVVHAIKESSCLANVLQVGDYIVSFNGEDSTSWNALTLTKKISKSFDERKRVFGISRRRQVALDDDDKEDDEQNSVEVDNMLYGEVDDVYSMIK